MTNRPGLLLGVLAADCGPVLLADPEAGVIGAAHAGWKGALCGVLESVIAAMEALSAARAADHGGVGPVHRAGLLRGWARVRGALRRR